MKTKTMIHYILSLLTEFLLTVVSISLFVFIFWGNISGWGWTFLMSFIVLLISLSAITMILSEFKNSIKTIIPIFTSAFALSFFIMIVEILCSKWKSLYISSMTETNKPNVGLIIILIIFIIIVVISLLWSNIYLTIFSMIPTTSNRAEEWEVINYLKLFFSHSKIYHLENFSYLTNNKNKLFIIKFITDDNIERKINFEYKKIFRTQNELKEEKTEEKIIPPSDEILSLQKAIKNTNKVFDEELKGIISYMSNNLPEVIGEKDNNIEIIKNKTLFKMYKTISKTKNKIDFESKKGELS